MHRYSLLIWGFDFYIYFIFVSQGIRMRLDFHHCVKQKGSIPHPIWLQVLCEPWKVSTQFGYKI